MTQLDTTQISSIAHKTPTAEATFTILAVRERARSETDLRRLRQELVNEGFRIVPSHFLEVFESLAKLGIGVIEQRTGGGKRFRWHLSLRDVAKSAFGNNQPSLKLRSKALPGPAIERKELVAYLSPGRTARLSLPPRMTKAEIGLLCTILLNEVQ